MSMKKASIYTGIFLIIFITTKAVGIDSLVGQIKSGGYVLMIRHAYAPGTGDPENFRIGKCATQRNLNDQGRAQAQEIGLFPFV